MPKSLAYPDAHGQENDHHNDNVSLNLVAAIEGARLRGLMVLGIVARKGGYTAKVADSVIIVPTVD